jgi:membrane protease YdiL (CAAX protease family)
VAAFVASYVVLFVLKEPIWSVVWPYDFADVDPNRRAFHEVAVPLLSIFFLLDVAMVSLLEEIVYRGMLFGILRNELAYVAISSALFAGIHSHQGLLAVVQAWLFGIVACFLFLRFKSVVPLIVAHIAINLLTFSMYPIPTDG